MNYLENSAGILYLVVSGGLSQPDVIPNRKFHLPKQRPYARLDGSTNINSPSSPHIPKKEKYRRANEKQSNKYDAARNKNER